MSDFIVSDTESNDCCENPVRQSSSSQPKFHETAYPAYSPKSLSLSRRVHVENSKKIPHSLKEDHPGDGLGSGRERERYMLRTIPGGDEDSFEEPVSILKFSPPRFKSPSKSPPANRTVTPRTSPTKPKLLSPSKNFRIPTSPHRPSVDAFWSQEVMNDWNDQYSPKKTPKSVLSTKVYPLNEVEDDDLSPWETGRRSPSKTPAKGRKEAAEKRKAFEGKKYGVAASFLKELDETIADGQIANLTKPTGGVRLVWSRKLQSTAGRASWKREAISSKDSDGTISATKYRHHASIELAEKVIDDDDRLINVIAHEFCHLLNFMISNVKDQPHGKEFKMWAKKCSVAFAYRGVNVTTKHSYEISYKYIWACTHCGNEYKRHSKSIDPRRQSCGKCKEKLMQVKPVPRGEGKGISEYQRYIKERFALVKKEKPGLGMGEIMVVLGKEFREIKEKRKEALTIERRDADGQYQNREEDKGFDSVVRKLDFLKLG